MKQLTFMILLLWSWQLQGQATQEMKPSIYENHVIAIPGLNMRATPGLDGKKVGYIPYGNEVKILKPHTFYRDTIGEIKNHYKGNRRTYYPNPVLDGYWVKVSYQGNTGYVFSAYLISNDGYATSKAYTAKIETPDMNKDYVLLFEGAGCRDNFHYDKNMYYYGAQMTSEGICLIPTELSFTKTGQEEFTSLRITSAIQDFYPTFIIGSRQPLTVHQIKGTKGLNINTFQDTTLNNVFFDELIAQPVEGQRVPDLVLTRNGQSQVLNPYTDPEKKRKNIPMHLMFKGDIDSDGQDDYIISFGEKFSQTILYLSSEATEGQLVKPVAVWYDGSCC